MNKGQLMISSNSTRLMINHTDNPTPITRGRFSYTANNMSDHQLGKHNLKKLFSLMKVNNVSEVDVFMNVRGFTYTANMYKKLITLLNENSRDYRLSVSEKTKDIGYVGTIVNLRLAVEEMVS